MILRGVEGTGQPPQFPSPFSLRPSFSHLRVPPRPRPCSPLSACVAPQSDVNAMQISNGGEIEIERASKHSDAGTLSAYPATECTGWHDKRARRAAPLGRGGWPPTPGGNRARIPSVEPADKFNGRPLNRLNRDSDEIFTCGKKGAFFSSVPLFRSSFFVSLYESNRNREYSYLEYVQCNKGLHCFLFYSRFSTVCY